MICAFCADYHSIAIFCGNYYGVYNCCNLLKIKKIQHITAKNFIRSPDVFYGKNKCTFAAFKNQAFI